MTDMKKDHIIVAFGATAFVAWLCMALVIQDAAQTVTPLYESCIWGPPVSWSADGTVLNAATEKYVLLDGVRQSSRLACSGWQCVETIAILLSNGSRDCFLYEQPNKLRDIWRATEPKYAIEAGHVVLAVLLGIVGVFASVATCVKTAQYLKTALMSKNTENYHDLNRDLTRPMRADNVELSDGGL